MSIPYRLYFNEMTFQNPRTQNLDQSIVKSATSTKVHSASRPFDRRKLVIGRKLAIRLTSGLMALGLSLGSALPTVAADPFRANTSTATHDIGPLTERAFQAIFKEGNYIEAKRYLAEAQTAESEEPLVHAMLASMSYLSGDLPAVNASAIATKNAAETLKAADPLRGHLYSAVGTFLQGAYILKTEGVAKGTPAALGMLQQVFSELDEAESINPSDPELNLIKGYMDLMLAVNLPFSNPEGAISQMSTYGSPVYLTQRGIALGYRDLQEYGKAIEAVDQALAIAPENPELIYLKAQVLAKQGAQADSTALFQQALAYADQLPTSLVKQMTWERCLAEGIANAEQCKVQRNAAEGAF
ncbi:MAG: TPR repeat [Phormidesmis priestleyi Ana]|uniref:TPR repeat n=1 Tax=Phormidesmis priestleyi Ana TaxID=1666911 RepID=A0A0N8KN03_9CYAN|nr:MAG: TPR repeat [Phormidesmis priestleyi Ana]